MTSTVHTKTDIDFADVTPPLERDLLLLLGLLLMKL